MQGISTSANLSRRSFVRKAAIRVAWLALPLRVRRVTARREGRIETFGGAAHPGVDNCGALRRAFADASRDGACVLMGPGVYEFSSADLLRRGSIKRPAGVALVGAGARATALQITGNTAIN